MPLRGGASDKYGNRYEGKWTVYCLAQVMAEEIDSIYIEPLGPEGEGCEFWTKKGNITKYHQVKRQHAKPGGWDTSELFANKVLTNAFEKTIAQNSKFIFISTDSAGLLDELIDAAGKNTEYDEFVKFFLSSKDRITEWNKILKGWCPLILEKNSHINYLPKEEQEVALGQISHEHLKRIEIRTIDEDSLKENVETKLRTFLRGDYEGARQCLADYALENIHKIVFADALWVIMESRGYLRLDYSKDKSVLASVDDCNKRYESMIRPISGNISIPRDETGSICDIILGEDKKHSVLVSGKAGVGKTYVLGESIKCIISRGIPHLYVKVDRLNPTELPEKIGEQLRLPGSPVEVLGNIAKTRQSVLIIDQLDAVSTASGRNPEFFFCIDEIIRQTEHYPNMRLLMACRSFDLEKDNRLRELVSEKGPAQEVEVKLLSVDAVKSTLVKLKYNPSEFSEKQIELLQLPLRLSIFAQMKCRPQKEVNKFSTSTDLFNDYWDFKENAVRERIGKGASQWTNVIDKLCGNITENQVLSVYENIVLDDFKETVRAMESEHVLVLEDKKISFFHETFYDYSFARRFVSKGKDLIEYLKTGEQHLFKRATLRQVLFHIYDHSHSEYLTAMGRILDDPNIRFHIKKCVLELMGQLDYVDDEAWSLLKGYIADTKALLFREVFFIFINSNNWFKFLNGKRIIAEWLDSGNEDIHKHALFILNNQIKYSPKESGELLKPYIGKSPEWNQKILNIISYQNLHLDRNIYELFIAMIVEGMMDDDKSHTFWLCTYELSKKKPAWSAGALGFYLKRLLGKININEIEHRFFKHDGTGERDLLKIAENAPVEYLDNVLPFFMKIVLETAKEIDGKLKIDKVWCYRFYREKDPVSLEDSILLGLEKALRILSEKHQLQFIKFFDYLSPYGDYDSINFLLIRALAICDHQLSDRAVGYILENPQRLESGWAGGGEGDFSSWPAYELTKHRSQLC
ncbi:MAG: NACHT domain-containing protein, partial [Clostridia bacterium]